MPITIPIEIGDVIRVGRFKNKRITVKEIGLDEYQLPTVNGKGIMKIRVEKLMPPKEPKQENNMKKITENVDSEVVAGLEHFIKLYDGSTFQGAKLNAELGRNILKAYKQGKNIDDLIKAVETDRDRSGPKQAYEDYLKALKGNYRKRNAYESKKPNKAKLDRMIFEAFHSTDTQVKIKQKDKLWWICQEETDDCLNAVGFDSKEAAEHSALTKGYNFSGQEEMNEIEPEVLTNKREKTKGVDKVEDMKLDKEKEIKLEILRIAKRVIKEELKKPEDEIQKVLDFIKSQIGLKLTPDSDFSGIKMHNGKKYFNVILNQRTSESDEFNLLDRFAKKGKLLKVEPNGLDRVAIFFDNSLVEGKKKVNLNELEVTDPDIVKKVEELAKLSDDMDRLENEMAKLKSQFKPLNEEITKLMDEAAKTGDRAIETKNILITIKRIGYEAQSVAWKEFYTEYFPKLNKRMKEQATELLESYTKIKKYSTTLAVQYKKSENVVNESLFSDLLNKVKSFFSNVFKSLTNRGREIDSILNKMKSIGK